VEKIKPDGKAWICDECFDSLVANHLPKLALANNIWIGSIPFTLRILTFAESLLIARHHPRCYVFKMFPKDAGRGVNPDHLQHGMSGNVTLYETNMMAISAMLQGQLLPLPLNTLASILAITFISSKKLGKNWMRSLFHIQRRAVLDALLWLKENNPLYGDVDVSLERIESLPLDDIPEQLEALVRQESNEAIATHERDLYVPDDSQNMGAFSSSQ